ncbi:DEAD/DEAH box helicase [Nocardia asteroides]|nr:DEAD/DEAH box helicase [Nocardia asteroides]UGT63459.1 DEAD/DEAH box helicase [Nocardia asteroides]
MACALLTPAEFTADPRTGAASHAAWAAAFADPAAAPALPPAAHAVPNATGTAVLAPERALAVARETAAVPERLAGRLHAELRPYQARGIGWLHETVAAHGGAVLADEMGLGKTVQAIGFLADRAGGPNLVVAPTSLVGNWIHEITRFAPELKARAWRGGPPAAEPGTVLVTGYPTLRLHHRELAGFRWETVIFDEAQALKNPRTQVAVAARGVEAAARIALTGTPVENDLDELFALLHLVAPRLFTHRSRFRRRYAKPIAEGDAGAAARLRDALEPVLLARRKSQVAAGLPAKIRSDLLCDLTAEQAALYDRVLDEAADTGFGTGLQRHGRVLAALTALKQVCDHPGLITGDLAEIGGRSGKVDLCTDIVAANLANAAPTLLFTQYRGAGELLVRHFAETFGLAVPFLHGGLDPAARAGIVRDFQRPDGPPVLVLSLRAAGTGLTLTRAADVVHVDRWWNPAVEAQATDRVHRIGQTRTVTVTTLTTATTVEEHIARLHDRKAALTDLGDSAGIAALARLDDAGLMEILRRSRGAV